MFTVQPATPSGFILTGPTGPVTAPPRSYSGPWPTLTPGTPARWAREDDARAAAAACAAGVPELRPTAPGHPCGPWAHRHGAAARRVLLACYQSSTWVTGRDVLTLTGLSGGTVARTLRQLCKAGVLARQGDGVPHLYGVRCITTAQVAIDFPAWRLPA